jgi:hypothetical protein
MLKSYNDALELWRGVGDFWTLLDNKKSITLIWQGIVEYITQLSEHEDVVAQYSIDDIPATETLRWEIVPLDVLLPNNPVSIPYLQDGINRPANIYEDGEDYYFDVVTKIVTWDGDAPAVDLFAPEYIIENKYLEKYFNNGFLDLDLTDFDIFKRKRILTDLWKAIKKGPSVNNISVIYNILTGTPYTSTSATVTEIGDNFIINPFISQKFLIKGGIMFPFKEKLAVDNDIVDSKFDCDCERGSHAVIDDILYEIVEAVESRVTVGKRIDSFTEPFDVYTAPLISVDVWEGQFVETEDGDRYLVENQRVAGNLVDGEYNLIIVPSGDHQKYEIPRGDYILAFDNGSTVPALTPIVDVLSISSWDDSETESIISGAEAKLRCNKHVSNYNAELSDIYTITKEMYPYIEKESAGDEILAENGEPLEFNGPDNILVLSDKNNTIDAFISEDSNFNISCIKSDRHDIVSLTNGATGEHSCTIVTGNTFSYRYGGEVVVAIPVIDGEETYHDSSRGIIVGGNYNKRTQQFTLEIRTDNEDGLAGHDEDSKIITSDLQTYTFTAAAKGNLPLLGLCEVVTHSGRSFVRGYNTTDTRVESGVNYSVENLEDMGISDLIITSNRKVVTGQLDAISKGDRIKVNGYEYLDVAKVVDEETILLKYAAPYTATGIGSIERGLSVITPSGPSDIKANDYIAVRDSRYFKVSHILSNGMLKLYTPFTHYEIPMGSESGYIRKMSSSTDFEAQVDSGDYFFLKEDGVEEKSLIKEVISSDYMEIDLYDGTPDELMAGARELDEDNFILSGTTPIDIDMLPLIKKGKHGQYGENMHYPIGSIGDNTFTVPTKSIDEFDNYVILYSPHYKASTYRISGFNLEVYTVDRDIEFPYANDGGTAVFIRRLQNHNGFIIADDETVSDIEKENIDKVLGLMLPSGSIIEWRTINE